MTIGVAPSPDPWRQDAAEVAAALASDVDQGLSAPEAAARLERYGPNRLDATEPVPPWRKLLAQFADPLVYLLIGAVVVSLVAWVLEGAEGVPFEVIVISAIIVANGVLGYVQEARAEQAVAALQRMAAATAGVRRGGREERVPAADLVPGDVLVLAEGDAVSADARLVEAASLTVAEASLTGESEPVVKGVAPLAGPAALGDRVNMVWSGTAVTRGRGRAVVTATGMATEMGTVARLLGRTEEERTPLQREVDRIGRTLGLAVDRHRRRGRGRHPAHRRHRAGLRPRRRAARRRVAGGGGRARGAAGDPVGGARPRGAAHGRGSGRSSRSCRRWRRWGRPRWCARTRPGP